MKSSVKMTYALLAVFILANCASKPKEAAPPPKLKETVSVAPVRIPLGPYHHRFYQGYRIETVKPEQFEEIINVKFLPLFAQAEPYGLYSYRPALVEATEGCTLPAEIALLTFQNEQFYGKYRETDIGKKIRDAHGLVFDFKTSSSLVPENYKNKVEINHAYNLNNDFKDYHDAYSALLVYCQLKSKDILLDLKKIYDGKTIARNIVFSVNPDHLAEYIFAPNSTQLKKLISERKKKFARIYNKSVVIDLIKEKIGTSRVKPGVGIDAKWSPAN